MANERRGMDAEFRVGASPTVVAKARNVKLSADAAEIDITSRASSGWKEFVQGLKSWTIDCDLLWVTDDAGMELLEAAFRNGTALAVYMTDQANAQAQAQGWSGSAIITKMERNDPLEGEITINFSCRGSGALTAIDPS